MSTIGADPEVFIRDTRTGSAVVVCGLLGGTKDAPVPLEALGKGFAVQEDNVMAEFNIPAAKRTRDFVQHINNGLNAVRNLVRTKGEYLDLDFASSRMFPHDALQSKQARLFGCSPDYNAYQDGAAHRPIRPMELEEREGAWRFAGGHVHIGYKRAEKTPPPHIVARFCDVFLGLPSVELDTQGKRRELYGQAGRFRPTDYGIEYRTLSNFWIFDRQLTERIGAYAFQLGGLLESNMDALQHAYQEIPWADVEEAINTENADRAADLVAYLTHDLGIGPMM